MAIRPLRRGETVTNYPAIRNFSRLTVLSCFLKAFTDGAVTTVSLKLFHASTILFV